MGISTDSLWCHLAFAHHLRLEFPLLADFEPKERWPAHTGRTEWGGTCERALFVLDRGWVIRWCYVATENIDPGVEGVLSALERLHEEGRRE